MKNFALPVLFFVVVYVLIVLPQGRRRRQAAALARAVEPGSRVMLSSGLYGIVVEIEPDTIIIEAAEGVHLRFAKAAVLRVVPDLVDPDDVDDDEYDEDEHDGSDHDGHDHDGHDAAPADEVARPSNREDQSKTEDSSNRQDPGNDAGLGPVP